MTESSPSTAPAPDSAAERISASVPDWQRERPRRLWDPSRRLLRTIRTYQRWSDRRGPVAMVVRRVCTLRHVFWSVACSSDIPLNSRIGGGLVMPHTVGIVVHPRSEIGVNCLIFQGVTVTGGVRIGGHVDIGAGAKILPGVVIGDHAKIGANAVVVSDVPSHATAVGVPARVLERA